MTNATKSPLRTGTYTIGRSGFAKISAVEGVKTSRQMEKDFQEFDRERLTPAERRKALARKYGHKS
jgi:hypothetical protein